MHVRNLPALAVAVLAVLVANTGIAQVWSAPRTAAGHPDLQGYWINNKNVVFERPVALGNKRAYSEAEAQALIEQAEAQQRARIVPADPGRPAPPAGEIITNVADANFHPELYTDQAYIDGEYRTSIVIDPPNGRIPYREDAIDIHGRWLAEGFGNFDGPESRTAAERCLNYPGQLPVIVQIPPEDSKTLQILQTMSY